MPDIKVTTVPPEPPSPTYTISGLDIETLRVITVLLGRTRGDVPDNVRILYTTLSNISGYVAPQTVRINGPAMEFLKKVPGKE